ncbi:MAG: alpha/beta hydrolase [Acidobacteria bacterium]|nr:alpha/beta hydrolase [Acidobacteriota bacterium]
MPLDPELLPLLGGPATSDLDHIGQSRAIAKVESEKAVASRPVSDEVSWRDTEATDHDGREVKVRVYSRHGLPTPAGAMLFVHGGAFVFGDLELEHDRCMYYAAHADALIAAVDYRLAPEFPYPAAHDDVWLALEWLVDAADELGVDVKRICLGGASAGGSLAQGVALRSRDEAGPVVAAVMLMYPVLDDRGTTASMASFEVYEPWDASRARKMWPLYLGHGDDAPAYAAPARAQDLRRLPPTFVMSCEEDPLRDEDLAFAQRLIDAGVSVELHHYRGTYHAFDVIGPQTTVGRRALREQATFLQHTVGRPIP